jgi:hypothetical protein
MDLWYDAPLGYSLTIINNGHALHGYSPGSSYGHPCHRRVDADYAKGLNPINPPKKFRVPSFLHQNHRCRFYELLFQRRRAQDSAVQGDRGNYCLSSINLPSAMLSLVDHPKQEQYKR